MNGPWAHFLLSAFFLTALFGLLRFFLLAAARMLSTRFGYGRPALRARRLAEAFCEGDR